MANAGAQGAASASTAIVQAGAASGYKGKGVGGRLYLPPYVMKCLYPLYLQGIGHVPCGRCMACRINRTSDWAIRILHEAALCDQSAFLTLTYSDEYLPEGNNLSKDDVQKWLKRYRKQLGEKRIKYYLCGEYGEDRTKRAHYHAIILGDRVSKKDLQKTWPYGHVFIGTVTFDSCAYVAAYVQKKLGGKMADEEYNGRQPPFQLCSKNLGAKYVDMFRDQMLVNGYITVRGKKMRIPRYYYKKLKDDIPLSKINAELLERTAVRLQEAEERGLDPLEEWKRDRDDAQRRLEELVFKQRIRRRKL